MLKRNPNVIYEFEEPEPEPEPELIGKFDAIPVRIVPPQQPENQPFVSVKEEYPEKNAVMALENELEPLVWDALAPLHLALGAIEAAMGGNDVRRHYKWESNDKGNTVHGRASAVVVGNKTLREFYRKNRHLGDQLLHVVLALQTKEPVEQKEDVNPADASDSEEIKQEGESEEDTEGVGKLLARIESSVAGFQMIGVGNGRVIRMGRREELQQLQQLQRITGNMLSETLSPSWVWCALPMATFRFLLNHTTLGGLEMVASDLGRLPQFRSVPKDQLLFDLLSSDEVRDVFCEYVAQRFTKPSGGNAYIHRIAPQQSGGMQFNVSAGFKTRAMNAKWRMGAHLWFQHNVHYVAVNGAREFVQRQARLQDQLQRVNDTLGKTNDGLLEKQGDYNRKIRNRGGHQRERVAGIELYRSDDPDTEREFRHERQVIVDMIAMKKSLEAEKSDLENELVKITFDLDCVPTRKLVVRSDISTFGHSPVHHDVESQQLRQLIFDQTMSSVARRLAGEK